MVAVFLCFFLRFLVVIKNLADNKIMKLYDNFFIGLYNFLHFFSGGNKAGNYGFTTVLLISVLTIFDYAGIIMYFNIPISRSWYAYVLFFILIFLNMKYFKRFGSYDMLIEKRKYKYSFQVIFTTIFGLVFFLLFFILSILR